MYSRKLAEYINICKKSPNTKYLCSSAFLYLTLNRFYIDSVTICLVTLKQCQKPENAHTPQALLFGRWWWRQRQQWWWRWSQRLWRQTRQGPFRAHAPCQAETRLAKAAAQGKGVVPETLNFILG